ERAFDRTNKAREYALLRLDGLRERGQRPPTHSVVLAVLRVGLALHGVRRLRDEDDDCLVLVLQLDVERAEDNREQLDLDTCLLVGLADRCLLLDLAGVHMTLRESPLVLPRTWLHEQHL